MGRARSGQPGGAAGMVLALVSALVLVVASCADDDGPSSAATDGGRRADCPVTDEVDGEPGGLLASLQDAGTVTAGIADEVPYGYLDDTGTATGMAPEVARAVLCELGIGELRAEVVDFGNLIAGLQAGQYDMIAAGMFITPERARQILFSDPDYCASESLLVPEGNPDALTDYPSLIDAGVTVAVLQGSVEEGYLATAGVPQDQIELFDDVDDQYEALAAGRVDVVTGTNLTVTTRAAAMPGFEAVAGFFPLDEDGEPILGCGAPGFDDEEFRDAYDAQLDGLQADGTVMEIVTGFGFAEADVLEAQDLTVADLVG